MAIIINPMAYEDFLVLSGDGASFTPCIRDVESLGLTYCDGRVEASVSVTESNGEAVLNIGTWDSDYPGNGHSRAALEWLRASFDKIIIHAAGEIDEDGVADIPTLFWLHMHSHKLVDIVLLDNGEEITPEIYSNVQPSQQL